MPGFGGAEELVEGLPHEWETMRSARTGRNAET